jgi:hypothetical protein
VPHAIVGFRRQGKIVDGMGVTALDLGLRGAAAGLFLMMLVVMAVRARPLDTLKWLGAAMSAAGAAYAIVTAPFVPKVALLWAVPILAANPVIFWLWAQAAFDDDFVVRRWHGALWLVVVGKLIYSCHGCSVLAILF